MYGKDEAHIHSLHSVRASVLGYCIESGDGLSGIPMTIRDKLDKSYGDVPKVKNPRTVPSYHDHVSDIGYG